VHTIEKIAASDLSTCQRSHPAAQTCRAPAWGDAVHMGCVTQSGRGNIRIPPQLSSRLLRLFKSFSFSHLSDLQQKGPSASPRPLVAHTVVCRHYPASPCEVLFMRTLSRRHLLNVAPSLQRLSYPPSMGCQVPLCSLTARTAALQNGIRLPSAQVR
jgi:hypothetical protein